MHFLSPLPFLPCTNASLFSPPQVEADGPLCFCRLRSQEGGKAEDSEWEEVNRLLDCQGLGRLPQRPTLADVRSALTSALEELRLRGRTSAEALAEARRRDGDVLEAAERREAMLREEKRKAAEAANAAEAEADRLRQGALKAEARARRTEAESTGLRRQLAAAEANTRGKEREIEKLRAAVMQKVDREEAVAARHKDAYARLRRGVEGHRRSKELRAEEIAGIYQEQVDAALSEAVAARTEAARMAAEVTATSGSIAAPRSPFSFSPLLVEPPPSPLGQKVVTARARLAVP